MFAQPSATPSSIPTSIPTTSTPTSLPSSKPTATVRQRIILLDTIVQLSSICFSLL